MIQKEEFTVEFLYKHGGARSLVGLELYYKGPQDRRTRRVKLVKLNADGNSYKATDVQADVGLVADILPEHLTVEIATRKRGEPIIKLLEACDLNVKPFLDPIYERTKRRETKYLTPQSDFEPFGRGGIPERRLGPPNLGEDIFVGGREEYQRGHTGAHAAPFARAAPSPRPYLEGRGFSPMGERGPSRGPIGRAVPYIQFAPQV
jgi:hypothetical protein